MNPRILIAAVLLLVGTFALGRWSAPEKVRVETKVVEVEKEQKHEDVVTVELTRPDGTRERTTHAVTDSVQSREIAQESVKEVSRSSSKVTVSLLAGVSVSSLQTVVYGASVSKPVLGPIALGAFGFSDGRVGLSLGLSL